MATVGLLFFVVVGVFAALLFLQVESWTTRIVLAAIVGGVYAFLGPPLTMAAAAVFSIGILLGQNLPTLS